MNTDSIDQENNDLRQNELRSQQEVDSIAAKLSQLRKQLEVKRQTIRLLESELQVNIDKRQKLDEQVKIEIERAIPKKHVLIPSNTLLPVSSSFIQSLSFSSNHSDSSFSLLQLPSSFSTIFDSARKKLASSLTSKYGYNKEIPNVSLEEVLAYIRNVFYLATHQQDHKQADFVIPPLLDPGKITLLCHRTNTSIFLLTEQPKIIKNETEEEKKEAKEEVNQQEEEKEKEEEAEEEDFIPFTKEKPVVEETPRSIMNALFSILSDKEKCTARKRMWVVVPNLPTHIVNKGLIYMKSKLEENQKNDLCWLLYIKLFCIMAIDLNETTIRQIILSALANCPDSVSLHVYVLQLVCSTGCSDRLVKEIWSKLVAFISTHPYNNSLLVFCIKYIHFACPAILADKQTIDWLNQKLTGNYAHYFHCILRQEKMVPVLIIPSSCPVYISCMRLVQRYKEFQSTQRKDALFEEDCSTFIIQTNHYLEGNQACSCGCSTAKHKVLIHLITFLVKQNDSFNYNDLFTPLLQCTKETSLVEIYKAIDSCIDDASIFGTFITSLNIPNTTGVHYNLTFALRKAFQYLRGNQFIPSYPVVTAPEYSLACSLVALGYSMNVLHHGLSFYQFDWKQRTILPKEVYDVLWKNLMKEMFASGISNSTPIENLLMVLLCMGLTCYYDGYGEMITRFHEILNICKSPALWSCYFEIITNCPGVHMNKRYLSSVESFMKAKKVYLEELVLVE